MDFQRKTINPKILPEPVRAKWKLETLSEGFVPFPKRLLRTMHSLFPENESVKDIALLLAVADFRRPNLTRQPSREFLAFIAGLSFEEFQLSLDRLSARQLIRYEEEGEEIEINTERIEAEVEKFCKIQDPASLPESETPKSEPPF